MQHEHLRAAVGEHVRDLLAAPVPVDRHRARAQRHGRDRGLQELERVAQQQRDTVARTDAERREARCSRAAPRRTAPGSSLRCRRSGRRSPRSPPSRRMLTAVRVSAHERLSASHPPPQLRHDVPARRALLRGRGRPAGALPLGLPRSADRGRRRAGARRHRLRPRRCRQRRPARPPVQRALSARS